MHFFSLLVAALLACGELPRENDAARVNRLSVLDQIVEVAILVADFLSQIVVLSNLTL